MGGFGGQGNNIVILYCKIKNEIKILKRKNLNRKLLLFLKCNIVYTYTYFKRFYLFICLFIYLAQAKLYMIVFYLCVCLRGHTLGS